MNIIPIKPQNPSRPTTRQPADTQFPKVIAITSGKGGVGKTNVTSNLAIALAQQGNRVCIFDADTSLANINVVMGLTVQHTIEHLLSGERSVDEILLTGPEGVMIVPAASGIAECANLDPDQRRRLIGALQTLESRFDYILIDTAAGIGDTVLSFVQSAQYAIVVISTEPTSLTDAFALLRVLKRRSYEHPVYVLVNMALNYANSMEVFKRFEAAVKKYLHMKILYLGYITEDKAIRTSISAQRPVLLQHPEALASRCFTTLATVLSKQFGNTPAPHSFSAYWSELSSAPASPPPTEPEATASQAATRPEPAERAWSQVRELIQNPAVAEEEIRQSLSPLLHAYVTRFRRLPLDRLDQLLPLLEQCDYPAAELHEHTAGLDLLFERQAPTPRPPGESVPTTAPEQDRILHAYRRSAERIQAEETLLHQALNRLYAYINRELVPAGRPSPPPEDRTAGDRETDPDSRLPDPGPG